MSDKTDLKPCPMCGGNDITIEYTENNYRGWWHECNNEKCGVRGPKVDTTTGAVIAWGEFAGIAERARTEQMEADCRVICDDCADGKPLSFDDGWLHSNGSVIAVWGCESGEIREAFQAKGEEVEA